MFHTTGCLLAANYSMDSSLNVVLGTIDANKEAFKSLCQNINGCVMEIALIKTK